MVPTRKQPISGNREQKWATNIQLKSVKNQDFVSTELGLVSSKLLNPRSKRRLHALPQGIFGLILVFLHEVFKALPMGLQGIGRLAGTAVAFFFE